MPTSGDKPGPGIYTCTNCGHSMTLERQDEELPPCPSCKGLEFSS